MHYDCIILGQGIAGTLLYYELKKRDWHIAVVDDGNIHASSKVAGAVLNPVNGKALWQTRRQETLQAFAIAKYREIGAAWQLTLLQEMPLLHFHTEERLRLYFEERSREIPNLLQVLSLEETADWQRFFAVDHGIGRVQGSFKIAAAQLLDEARQRIKEQDLLLTERWDWADFRVSAEGVAYKGITADKLICCEGAAARYNPYFKALPFTRNKGEALLLSIPGLPQQVMYQHGIRLTPRGNNLFWAGSNQTWSYDELSPDTAWAEDVLKQLKSWLKTEMEQTDHLFAERPTTAGQVIFAGAHPEAQGVLMLNGLGTRGFSAGPFYAAQLARQLCGEEPLTVLAHKSLA